MTDVYVVLKESVQVKADIVRVDDVAQIYTRKDALKTRLKKVFVHQFRRKQKSRGKQREVIGALYVLECIGKACPDCCVHLLGETDCLVEWVQEEKAPRWHRIWQVFKIVFVALLCFAGGAFSIMAFHNDISITDLFRQLYELVMGEKSSGCTILEMSYSIGLMVGIILFYNHIGKRRITQDPTPIEVSMRSYEKDLTEAMTSAWGREEKTIDVD